MELAYGEPDLVPVLDGGCAWVCVCAYVHVCLHAPSADANIKALSWDTSYLLNAGSMGWDGWVCARQACLASPMVPPAFQLSGSRHKFGPDTEIQARASGS